MSAKRTWKLRSDGRGRRFRRRREAEHDLRGRGDVHDGDLDRERRRPGRDQRPGLLRGVPGPGGAAERKEDLLEEVGRRVESAADQTRGARDGHDPPIHGDLGRPRAEQDLMASARDRQDAGRRVGGDRETQRPGGIRHNELASAERADRMGLSLPKDRRPLLGRGGAGGGGHEGEEEGESGRRSGGAAVSEPRMGAATDTEKRVARRARAGVSRPSGARPRRRARREDRSWPPGQSSVTSKPAVARTCLTSASVYARTRPGLRGKASAFST